MRTLLAIASLALLAACAGPAKQTPPQPELAQPEWPSAVGAVALKRAAGGGREPLLDVGLVIFDPGIPEDQSTHSALGIFPSIRQAESRYMPVVLRRVLIDSNAWGVVRVLPQADNSAQLTLNAKILHSDGQRLVLQVRAVDASGRNWLDRIYRDETLETDFPVAPEGEPYADLYHSIANDLLQVQRQLPAKALQDIVSVGQLRYAASLSPEAFAGYLQQDDSGAYRAVRLPAEGDPMLARVERIRNQEHLFVDTVDEQYTDLQQTMAPTYNLWRQYGRERAIYLDEYQQRVADRDPQGRRGSFYAMQRIYDAYKLTKIQEQDLDELAGGFKNEVQPTVMEASGQIYRLGGSLENQYGEWRNILRQIFALETGLQ